MVISALNPVNSQHLQIYLHPATDVDVKGSKCLLFKLLLHPHPIVCFCPRKTITRQQPHVIISVVAQNEDCRNPSWITRDLNTK